MAGKITVSTINDDTGVLGTQNGMTGIAKAWVAFNGTAGTVTNAFNVGSITKNSTGNYTLNFTTAMPNANYAVNFGVCAGGSGLNASFVGYVLSASQYGAPSNKTTSACQVGFGDYTSTPRDFAELYVTVLSN
jgi:hypothetical protein